MAYKLVPAAGPPLYAQPASSHATRGAFATHNLWVTPHSDSETWPAGMHPYARGRNQGLAQWTQAVGTPSSPCVAGSIVTAPQMSAVQAVSTLLTRWFDASRTSLLMDLTFTPPSVQRMQEWGIQR